MQGRTKKVIVSLAALTLATAMILFGFDRQSRHPGLKSSQATHIVSQPRPAQNPLTPEERKALIANATEGLVLERDDIEGMSFYSAYDGVLPLGERITSYLSVSDSGNVFLRVYVRYRGDDWIFFEKLKVKSDDLIVYEKTFEYSAVHRDNGSGSVWETADYHADPVDIAALRLIARSKKSTIRLSGDVHREDHDLLPNEINRIAQVLAAYDKLELLTKT